MMTFNPSKHASALDSHYDKEAKHYDDFNEARSAQINQTIEQILQRQAVRTVLDLTCGTGSQVFWLCKKGYDVVGVDINSRMLEIARKKAQEQDLLMMLQQGDMRTSKVGKFDAVITIFNSIGHLTCDDFIKTVQNIYGNLNKNGLYIFDIFNLDYLLYKDNITKLTIDWQRKLEGILVREIQYSTVTKDGILASYDIYHEQINLAKPKITTSVQTLQVYTAIQLKEILEKNGFAIIQQTDIDGLKLSTFKTERILTVAKKL